MITSNNNNDVYAIVGAKYHSTSVSAYLLSYEKTTNQWEHGAEFIPGGASANGRFDGTSISASYDQFGWDATISEEWVAISAPYDTASTRKVLLFWLNSVTNGGQLEPDTTLIASDKQYLTCFGMSVAMEGDTLVVGAANDRDNVGSVYVFRYNANGSGEWTQAAKLTPDDVSSGS